MISLSLGAVSADESVRHPVHQFVDGI